MEIKLRRNAQIFIIDIEGDMDLYQAYKLKELVAKMIQKNIVFYVINLEKVDYIDSSGVGALLYVHSALKKQKMKLLIANVHGSVKDVINLTQLMDYFNITKDVNTAIQELKPLIT